MLSLRSAVQLPRINRKTVVIFLVCLCVTTMIIFKRNRFVPERTIDQIYEEVILNNVNFNNCTNSTSRDLNVGRKIQTHNKDPLCLVDPPNLVGELAIPKHNDEHIRRNFCELYSEMAKKENDLLIGGAWKPHNCTALQNLAIIIPYRDRGEHLLLLLNHLHDILKRQLANYKIFVVEQTGSDEFNKGRLMNIGFDYVLNSTENVDCIIFHDVDLLAENDKNLYRCDSNVPRHLSPAVSSLKYKLPYHELIGGVFAITPTIFKRVNGYSNLYWGWGGEDDDMFYRLEEEQINVTRPEMTIGRYSMIHHGQRPAKDGKIRFKLVWSAKTRYKIDGLNQLHSLNCSIQFVEPYLLFTHIMVDVGSADKT